MSFEVRLASGEVVFEIEKLDHRLVKAVNIGPARYAVGFNEDHITLQFEFRAPSDLEFDGEEFDYDVDDYIVETREYLGQIEAPASKTEAEVEAELKELVGMKVVELETKVKTGKKASK